MRGSVAPARPKRTPHARAYDRDTDIASLLGDDADLLLNHVSKANPEGRPAPSRLRGRLGGTGLISGRKAFQRAIAEGIGMLNAIQDVYLDPAITIA